MEFWMPERVYYEPEVIDYELGRRLLAYMDSEGVEKRRVTSHNQVRGIPGSTPPEAYRNAKRTLVIGVRKSLSLEVCKPSADFEFALATGCPGGCQYCYLAARMASKPYVRVYVNVDEILQSVKKKIDSRLPATTVFEAASTSDPLAVEHLTGSLARAIEFFGSQEKGRLRFVTKYPNVDPLLSVPHNGHTRVRVSINTERVIRLYEHNTARLDQRIGGALRLVESGYPLGFIIAPVIVYTDYKEEYRALLDRLSLELRGYDKSSITFEVIQFRFTNSSRNTMRERFPGSSLDLDEEGRRLKSGKYGRTKYVYDRDTEADMRGFFEKEITGGFEGARMEYFT